MCIFVNTYQCRTHLFLLQCSYKELCPGHAILSFCLLTGASLAQDRGRMEARIEALTAEVSQLKKDGQVHLTLECRPTLMHNKCPRCNKRRTSLVPPLLSLFSISCHVNSEFSEFGVFHCRTSAVSYRITHRTCITQYYYLHLKILVNVKTCRTFFQRNTIP